MAYATWLVWLQVGLLAESGRPGIALHQPGKPEMRCRAERRGVIPSGRFHEKHLDAPAPAPARACQPGGNGRGGRSRSACKDERDRAGAGRGSVRCAARLPDGA